MRVDCTYTYHCDVAGCPVTQTEHWEYVAQSLLRQPSPPRGWTAMGALLFCPRHTILLQIDGQAMLLSPDAPPVEEPPPASP
jgi:hypothetical protein